MASLQCRQRRSKPRTGWLVVPEVDRACSSSSSSSSSPCPGSTPTSVPADNSNATLPAPAFCLSPKQAAWSQPGGFDWPEPTSGPVPEATAAADAEISPEEEPATAAAFPLLAAPLARAPGQARPGRLTISSLEGSAVLQHAPRGSGNGLEDGQGWCLSPQARSPSEVAIQAQDCSMKNDEVAAASAPEEAGPAADGNASRLAPDATDSSAGPSGTKEHPTRTGELERASVEGSQEPLVSLQELSLLRSPPSPLVPLCPSPALESPTPAEAPAALLSSLSGSSSTGGDSRGAAEVLLSPKLASSSSSSTSSSDCLSASHSWSPCTGSPAPSSPSAGAAHPFQEADVGKLDLARDAPMLAADLLFQEQRQMAKSVALEETVAQLQSEVALLKARLGNALEDSAAKCAAIQELQAHITNLATAARFWQEEASRLWLYQCVCGKQTTSLGCPSPNSEGLEISPRPEVEALASPHPVCHEEIVASLVMDPLPEGSRLGYETECQLQFSAGNAEGRVSLASPKRDQQQELQTQSLEPECPLAAEYRAWLQMEGTKGDDLVQCISPDVAVAHVNPQHEEHLIVPVFEQPEAPLTLEPEDDHLSQELALSKVQSMSQRKSALLLASVLADSSLQVGEIGPLMEEPAASGDLEDEGYDTPDEGHEVGMKLLSWMLRPLLNDEMEESMV